LSRLCSFSRYFSAAFPTLIAGSLSGPSAFHSGLLRFFVGTFDENTSDICGAHSPVNPERMVGNPEVSISSMRRRFAILSRVNHLPILLGTSSFKATGWEGSFYPKGMRSADYLTFYAEYFHTVEVDSTFYGCPTARTVSNWAARTPGDSFFRSKSRRSSHTKKRSWTAMQNSRSSWRR
jgi:hypothetical protein